MCFGSSRAATPPVPPKKLYVPLPDYTKTSVPGPPETASEMEANRNKQARVGSARKRLKQSETGSSALRIKPNTYGAA
jgi:hypothetical protein